MRLPVNPALPLAALVLLSACGGGGGSSLDSAPIGPSTGPSGDYPMVLGQSYTVDGVTYTPADTLNYDAVGYAGVNPAGGASVSGSHRTLPLPSYVEVTALDSGKTILVRLELRGPLTNARLIDLSPAAAAQLGVADRPNAPVRVRRVNPPEQERALLRMGQPAPARMDTPASLLGVLRRKLDGQGSVTLNSGKPMPLPPAGVLPPQAAAPLPAPVAQASPAPSVKPLAEARPRPAPSQRKDPPALQRGGWVVQVGAFSDRARADAVARRTGGQVARAGSVWRVRVGPFASQASGQAALAKARMAGFDDARIQRAD